MREQSGCLWSRVGGPCQERAAARARRAGGRSAETGRTRERELSSLPPGAHTKPVPRAPSLGQAPRLARSRPHAAPVPWSSAAPRAAVVACCCRRRLFKGLGDSCVEGGEEAVQLAPLSLSRNAPPRTWHLWGHDGVAMRSVTREEGPGGGERRGGGGGAERRTKEESERGRGDSRASAATCAAVARRARPARGRLGLATALTDLVAALAALDVDDLAHGCCVCF